jgi:ubiquinone/menaquinone biosynthesis C-methylase UbiE
LENVLAASNNIYHSEIEDCTQEWTFAPNSADYIHIRWLIGSIPDWNRFFEEAYKTCKPGGWVESFEPSGIITSDDDTVKENSALGQWGKLFIEGAKKFGMSFTVYEEELQRKAMEAAGFVDIQTHDFKVSESLATLDLEHRLQLDNY